MALLDQEGRREDLGEQTAISPDPLYDAGDPRDRPKYRVLRLDVMKQDENTTDVLDSKAGHGNSDLSFLEED